MALNVELKVNGAAAQAFLSETEMTITRSATEEEEPHSVIALNDIIAVEDNKSSSVDIGGSASYSCDVHFITRYNPKWTTGYLTLTSTDDTLNGLETFCSDLKLKFNNIAALRPKRLLVLMNMIAGKRQAQTMYDTVMTPIFRLAKVTCDLVVSQRPKHMIEIMANYDYKNVDGIVIMGGDGTVSEIINVLIKEKQEEAGVDYNNPKAELKPILKPIGIIPTGTGNATAESLYGCQDVRTVTLHVVKGQTKSASILGSYCENKLIGYCGIAFGLLYAAELLHIADRQLRWMRTARYSAAALVYLTKKMHVAPIEVTVYSREKQTREDTGDGERMVVEKEETFTQDCCMAMVLGRPITDKSKKYFINPSDSENAEDFLAVFYERFGKFEMLRHIVQMRSKTANDIFDNPKIKQVKGYAVRIKFLERRDQPAESDPRNLMVSTDGEIQDSPTADYYVKNIAHIVNVYCSR